MAFSFSVDKSISVGTSIRKAVPSILMVTMVAHTLCIVLLVFVRTLHDFHSLSFSRTFDMGVLLWLGGVIFGDVFQVKTPVLFNVLAFLTFSVLPNRHWFGIRRAMRIVNKSWFFLIFLMTISLVNHINSFIGWLFP